MYTNTDNICLFTYGALKALVHSHALNAMSVLSYSTPPNSMLPPRRAYSFDSKDLDVWSLACSNVLRRFDADGTNATQQDDAKLTQKYTIIGAGMAYFVVNNDT